MERVKGLMLLIVSEDVKIESQLNAGVSPVKLMHSDSDESAREIPDAAGVAGRCMSICVK